MLPADTSRLVELLFFPLFDADAITVPMLFFGSGRSAMLMGVYSASDVRWLPEGQSRDCKVF